MSFWVKTADALPDEGLIVITKIDDEPESRNVQPLMRKGRLWFLPDGSMYVYYVPTHWKPLASPAFRSSP